MIGRQFGLPTVAAATGMAVMLIGAGCATSPRSVNGLELTELKRRATDCLKQAIRYPQNPAVRAAAVEAFESARQAAALPWVRSALRDEHPGVRFAACVALGTLKDSVAEDALRSASNHDGDASVKVAALFALHALGDTSRTGRMADYLLDHEDAAVRRNAALVLGRLDEPSVVKLLARAMRDPDSGVRFHALEGMARHGNNEARQQLMFMANSGVGSEEVMAIIALEGTRNPICTDLFRQKFRVGVHIETRLAAARALAMLGSSEGFDVAYKSLAFNKPRHMEPNDSPEDQILRARLLAASALGAMGDPAALPRLDRMMVKSDDPRIQVAAGKAILEIIAAVRRSTRADSPFGEPSTNLKR